MKIIINVCYGGYSISAFGIKEMFKRKGQEVFFYKRDFKTNKFYKIKNCGNRGEITLGFYATTKDMGQEVSNENFDWSCYIDNRGYRTDKDLIAVLEEYGTEDVGGDCSLLDIEEIEDGTVYKIVEYDGKEHIKYKEDENWQVAK